MNSSQWWCGTHQVRACAEPRSLAAVQLVSYLAPGYPAALFEAMAEAIGANLHFEVGRSGPDPAADPFVDGDADLAWVCSTSFVELTTDRPPSVELAGVAWVPDDPDAEGLPVYFSDLVVRPETSVAELGDLDGRRIGCNDPASLSGYHALRIELARRDCDPDSFAELVMTGGHHHSIDQLLAGELDAAVIDSVVRIRRARRWRDVADLRVIQRLGPWPTQPLVVRAGTDPAVTARVVGALLDANLDDEFRALLAASAIDRLVPVDVDHCSVVRTAMSALASANHAASPTTGPVDSTGHVT